MLARTAITPLDESFGHQLVAPRARLLYDDERWAERAYYLLHVDASLTLNAGRQLYPNAGRWRGFAAAATADVQHSLRISSDYSVGDDPDTAEVGPLRIEVRRPLEEVRLILDQPGFPVAYDLTYRARFGPVGTEPTYIEQEGAVVTNTMAFFQSGSFSGTVAVDGREWTVSDRAGFRDRSWGVRKHDGSPRRGIVVFCGCELEDSSLYVLFHETASGRRTFTNGWWISPDGVELVTGVEHDLVFGGHTGTLLEGGSLVLAFAGDRTERLEFVVENCLYLSGVGYSPEAAAREPGHSRADLTDGAVVAALDGQNDSGCRFVFSGERGHGYVETGLGTHTRYRPDVVTEESSG